MRKYHEKASTEVRFEYGVELHAGLTRFPQTAAAAADVLSINEALHAQFQKRVGLLVPMLKARAALRFAEYHVDGVIRSAYRAAQVEDGGRAGRLCGVLCPEGMRAVTRPAGRNQVKPTKQMIERLVHTQLPGVEAYRTHWLPKLQAALTQLEEAIATYEDAGAAHREAFAAEKALRDAHHDKVDQVMGLVRAAFPRDRDTQDVIFPPMVTAERQEGEEAEAQSAPA